MPNVLTSWKEIGQYLGKGVRTVQRWELELSLPVRRPQGRARHAVLAIPEELDEWARTRTRCPGGSAEFLQRELASLREENANLRRRLDNLETSCCAMVACLPDEQWLPLPFSEKNQGIALVRKGTRQGRSFHTAALEMHVQALRSRLSLAVRLCTFGERDLSSGFTDQACKAIRGAQYAADDIRRTLDEPGQLPAKHLKEIRGLLRQLDLRIRESRVMKELATRSG